MCFLFFQGYVADNLGGSLEWKGQQSGVVLCDKHLNTGTCLVQKEVYTWEGKQKWKENFPLGALFHILVQLAS